MGSDLEPAAESGTVVAHPVEPAATSATGSQLEPWRSAGAVAAVAAGSALAGAVAIAGLRALAHGGSGGPLKRGSKLRLGKRREKVVARRSFLIDVHVLGR